MSKTHTSIAESWLVGDICYIIVQVYTELDFILF